jgi:hypothetical protein
LPLLPLKGPLAQKQGSKTRKTTYKLKPIYCFMTHSNEPKVDLLLKKVRVIKKNTSGIRIASPECIRRWGDANHRCEIIGEVTKCGTLNYKLKT